MTCINDLPQNIIVRILDCMPIQDAVKTSVLCRSWRFNWTMLENLIFDTKFVHYLERKMGKGSLVKIINRLLLCHQGTIQKFVLLLTDVMEQVSGSVNEWIFFLSRKGIKEFTLHYRVERKYKLPTYFCSFIELTSLELHDCVFQATPEFREFPSLKHLKLIVVTFEPIAFWKYFAHCPLLEMLVFNGAVLELDSNDITKLQNLKRFDLYVEFVPAPNVVKLVHNLKLLPKLEEVFFCSALWKASLVEAQTWKCVPAIFPCLRVLRLEWIELKTHNDFLLACQLICSSPNLREVVIQLVVGNDLVSDELPPSYQGKHCTIGKLQIVKLRYFTGLRNEVRLVKFLLASSPLLEKMFLTYHSPSLDKVAQLKKALRISKDILTFHRASPIAEIDLSYRGLDL